MRRSTTVYIAICFLIIMLCGVVPLRAQAADKGTYFKAGELYYHTIAKNKVEVCGTSRNKGTLTIPAKIKYQGKKYTVTQIADYQQYRGQDDDTAGDYTTAGMDLPLWQDYSYPYRSTKGKRLIPKDSELCYREISKLVLPDTITYIGEGAFADCTELKSVVFAKKYKKLRIGKNAFQGETMQSIRFPEGTYELGDCAAGRIKSIYIPSTVKKIGASVINVNTTKITIDKNNKHYKMKDGILYSYNEKELIGASGNVKGTVKVSARTRKISENAFAYTNVKKVILNNKIRVIPRGAFIYCSKLEKVANTKGVRRIEYGAFEKCESLEDIGTLPNLKVIERSAFWYDQKLNISLSKTVTTVDEYAFSGWGYLSDAGEATVSVAKDHPFFSVQNGLLIMRDGTDQKVILCMNEAKKITIPEGVTEVTCLVGNENCSEIILPSTLKLLTGSLVAKEGKVTFTAKEPPQFRISYSMWVKKVVIPKGTYTEYMKAIEEAGKDTVEDDETDKYCISVDRDVVIVEE